MVPEARNKFGAPMFEPKAFRKKMYCIEESTCDHVGTRGIVPPFPHCYAPSFRGSLSHIFGLGLLSCS